jgi:hypothetical protein
LNQTGWGGGGGLKEDFSRKKIHIFADITVVPGKSIVSIKEHLNFHLMVQTKNSSK